MGVSIVGCNKKEEPPTVRSTATNADATAVPAASVGTPTAAPAAKVETPAAPATPPVADVSKTAEPQVTAPAANSAATADAQSKLDLVTQYIKDKKYDLAEKLLSQLDANKSILPASLQNQITTAQATLKTAKAASGTSDALGGLKAPAVGN